MPFAIPRPPRVDPPVGQGLRAGSVRVDITPGLGIGLAGHGPNANAAQGVLGRLFASVLLIEDRLGVRVALIAVDLHAGSRYISERLGSRLADVGLSVDRIVFAGSHTHRSPASIYGNASYDRLTGPAWVKAAWGAHFDQGTADAISDRIEAGVRAILGPAARTPDLVTLRRAVLGITAPLLWGWVTNRSGSSMDGSQLGTDADGHLWDVPPALDPQQLRDLGAKWTASAVPAWVGGAVPPGEPSFRAGALTANPVGTLASPPVIQSPSPAPADTLEALFQRLFGQGNLGPAFRLLKLMVHSTRRPFVSAPLHAALVDARLHLLIARERHPTGAGAGPLIGAFGSLGATPSLLGARHAVFNADAFGHAASHARRQLDVPVPVGIAGGGLGDVNLVPRGLPLDELRDRGRTLDGAAAMVREVGCAVGDALLHGLRDQPMAWEEHLTLSVGWQEPTPAELGLDPVGVLGGPSLGGSELASSPLAALLPEGLREDPPYMGHQAPKARLPPLEAPPPLPLRKVVFSTPTGPWWGLAGCPTETSAALAAQIRDGITGGAWPLTLVSPCGEFSSYAGTRWQYVSQCYEASATLFGRYTGDAMALRLPHIGPTLPDGQAEFSSTAGTLPLRLGAKGEKKGDRPNAISLDIALHGSAVESLRGHGKPELKVILSGGWVRILASFDGAHPNGPAWDGPWVALARTDASRGSAQGARLAPSDLPITDATVEVLVWADVRADRTRWRVELRAPSPPAAPLALVVFPPLTGAAGPRFLDANGFFDGPFTP